LAVLETFLIKYRSQREEEMRVFITGVKKKNNMEYRERMCGVFFTATNSPLSIFNPVCLGNEPLLLLHQRKETLRHPRCI